MVPVFGQGTDSQLHFQTTPHRLATGAHSASLRGCTRSMQHSNKDLDTEIRGRKNVSWPFPFCPDRNRLAKDFIGNVLQKEELEHIPHSLQYPTNG